MLQVEIIPQMASWQAETPRALPARGCSRSCWSPKAMGDLGTPRDGLGPFLRHGERSNRVVRGVGMGSLNYCSEEMAILGANLQESGGFHSLGHDVACSHGGKPIIK